MKIKELSSLLVSKHKEKKNQETYLHPFEAA